MTCLTRTIGSRSLKAACLVTCCFLRGFAADGGQAPASGAPAASGAEAPATPDLPFSFDGPSPPLAPAVITRDSAGRATIRAVRVTSPLRLDGLLDEVVYSSVPSVSEFIQVEPQEGAPASEKTELWLLYDANNVYVSFRCWESEPARVVANEMRRDSTALWQGNDIVGVIFDTFYDRRNAVQFTVNSIGGRSEGQLTNGQYSGDWNTVWEVKTGRFEGGWTVEAAVPFKSLRYRPGRTQIWGLNALRTNRWKNEISFITRIPNAMGQRGLNQPSLAATVVGLEAPSGSKNLEVKPYAISDVTTNPRSTPAVSGDVSANAGFDVKYGLTQNLTSDFSYRTDFAQVEADEQQVNLSRFSLFYPEKREFFLENQGIFSFGGAVTGGQMAAASDTPIMFYSRRIGLNGDRTVPIQVGGRLTGRVGRHSVGALSMRTDEDPLTGFQPTTFSVVRLKRDVLRKSSVGVLATGRSVGRTGVGSNTAYGADGTFAFYDNLTINTYWARTRTDGLSGEDTSYRAQLDYAGDRYGVQAERLVVGDNFNPEVGFVRRDNMKRSFGLFRFSPRPASIRSVRKFSWTGSMGYIENGTGRLETRDGQGEFAIEFQNSDRFSVGYGNTYEFLPRPFQISPGIVLPVGGYQFSGGRVGFNLGPQRNVAANFLVEFGGFYSGSKLAVSATRGRVKITPQVSAEPTVSINWVDLAEGSFTAKLVGSRVTYTMTPLMFVSALVQYNSSTNAAMANVRLRWEYRPGSELFVVYNEERDTLARGFPDLANRAVIIKINRLFKF